MDDARVASLLDVVGSLYSSAIEPERMVEALSAFGSCVRASAAQVYSFDRATGQILDSRTNEAVNEKRNAEYLSTWGAKDPRVPALAALPSGAVLRCHERFGEDFVGKDSFYQEFFIPNGFRWAMGGCVHFDDGTSTVLASVRAPDEPAFGEADAAFMRHLLPHLKRAATLRAGFLERLQAVSCLEDVVRAYPHPCLVVDRSGHVVVLSEGCKPILARLRMSVKGGRLGFDELNMRQRWMGSGLLSGRRDAPFHFGAHDQHGVAWTIHATPWCNLGKARDGVDQGLVIVSFERAATMDEKVDALAASTALTPAEAAVLSLLGKGLSTSQIAMERATSTHTVRTQIRLILEKTGCFSQRELLARLCHGEPAIGPAGRRSEAPNSRLA